MPQHIYCINITSTGCSIIFLHLLWCLLWAVAYKVFDKLKYYNCLYHSQIMAHDDEITGSTVANKMCLNWLKIICLHSLNFRLTILLLVCWCSLNTVQLIWLKIYSLWDPAPGFQRHKIYHNHQQYLEGQLINNLESSPWTITEKLWTSMHIAWTYEHYL